MYFSSDFVASAVSKIPMMPSSSSQFSNPKSSRPALASLSISSSSHSSDDQFIGCHSVSDMSSIAGSQSDNELAASIARIGCLFGSPTDSESVLSGFTTSTFNSSGNSNLASTGFLPFPPTTPSAAYTASSPALSSSLQLAISTASAFTPTTSSSVASMSISNQHPQLSSNSMPSCIRINGRKVFGPPDNWIGDPPPISAELFVKGIPRGMDEHHLHAFFRRHGPIYCIRLMVDYNDLNRGFGYVHYANVAAADRALYLMQHCYVQPNVRLHLERSYDKCRLFVSKLPKNLRVNKVRQRLHETFPEVKSVVVYHATGLGRSIASSSFTSAPWQSNDVGMLTDSINGNRGFAFLDFPTHNAAIRAKQLASTGQMRIFGQNVQVVWANPERAVSSDAMRDVRTLFMRNVDMRLRQTDLLQIISRFVPSEQVRRLSRNRDLAFVELQTRTAAQRLLECLDGYISMGRPFDVQWSIPPNRDTLHGAMHPVDHEAALRLVCVSNEWLVPIYLFGRVCTRNLSQYVCVILAAASGDSMQQQMEPMQERCALIMELRLNGVDLQARAAQVALSLVQRCGRLPQINYVLLVEANMYHIVGHITDLANASFQRASPTVALNLCISTSEVFALSRCSAVLLALPRQRLQHSYELALRQPMLLPPPPPGCISHAPIYLPDLQIDDRIFGCVNPQYRRPAPLLHDIDMGQVVLVACEVSSGRNFHITSLPMYSVNLFEGTQPTTSTAAGVLMPYECVQLEDAYEMMGIWHPNEDFQRPVDEHFVVFFGPLITTATEQQHQIATKAPMMAT